MKLNLKICGLRDWENIRQVMELSPEYMGFIFYDKSPRFVGDDFKMPDTPFGIKKVGVFVNGFSDKINSITEKFSLDFVQLHGSESVETCAHVKDEGIGVIKVFSVDEDFDFKKTEPYQSVVDYFLFDTKGEHYGGNGKKFDWNILNRYNQKVPFFLGGGISLENMQEVFSLKNLNIHGIDVNSGVEVSPGFKDITKVKRLKAVLNTESKH